jgi:hypothetical protein
MCINIARALLFGCRSFPYDPNSAPGSREQRPHSLSSAIKCSAGLAWSQTKDVAVHGSQINNLTDQRAVRGEKNTGV